MHRGNPFLEGGYNIVISGMLTDWLSAFFMLPPVLWRFGAVPLTLRSLKEVTIPTKTMSKKF